jgi:hypothetical protein
MWKVVFIAAALALSISPVDARRPPAQPDRVEKRDPSELRRDVERISREIYPERRSDSPARRGSLAAGSASKKR